MGRRSRVRSTSTGFRHGLFDPFCPKALGLLGRNLPRTLKTRGIEIRMVPKRPDETVEPFEHTDDFEFAMLRRQLARFAADNAATLKTMQPTLPANMNNRAAANWKLSLGIAELGGETWSQQAREAAERLNRSGRQPSDGVRLLAAFRNIANSGKTKHVGGYGHRVVQEPARYLGDLQQGRQDYAAPSRVPARRLRHPPGPLHPTKRKDFARQGYKLEQFTDAFARYLPEDPIIQSPASNKRHQSARRNASAHGADEWMIGCRGRF